MLCRLYSIDGTVISQSGQLRWHEEYVIVGEESFMEGDYGNVQKPIFAVRKCTERLAAGHAGSLFYYDLYLF